jgi:predicted GTPase
MAATQADARKKDKEYAIGIFGRKDAGKSALINAMKMSGITDEGDSRVPIGEIKIIDTPAIESETGFTGKSIEVAYEVLRKCDLIVLVCDSTRGRDALDEIEEDFLEQLRRRQIPCIVALNKCGKISGIARRSKATDIVAVYEHMRGATDLNALREELKHTGDMRALAANIRLRSGCQVILTDAKYGTGIERLKQAIIENAHALEEEPPLVKGLIKRGDIVAVVAPMESNQPSSPLFLTQQQMIRDILEEDAIAVVIKQTELYFSLQDLKKDPALVITDSQALKSVLTIVDDKIPMTSFSLLYAWQRGDLEHQLNGIRTLEDLGIGDRVLIANGDSNKRRSDDIGASRLPGMIHAIQPQAEIDWSYGRDFPRDIKEYALIIQIGLYAMTRQEIKYRMDYAKAQGVPTTDYGLVFAYHNNCLNRLIRPFGLKYEGDSNGI